MSWGRDDPGFPPSPDPAAQAERYYAEQSRYEDPEPVEPDCIVCNDTGVRSEHHPACSGDERSCQRLCPVEAPCGCVRPAPLLSSIRARAEELREQFAATEDDDEVPF